MLCLTLNYPQVTFLSLSVMSTSSGRLDDERATPPTVDEPVIDLSDDDAGASPSPSKKPKQVSKKTETKAGRYQSPIYQLV